MKITSALIVVCLSLIFDCDGVAQDSEDAQRDSSESSKELLSLVSAFNEVVENLFLPLTKLEESGIRDMLSKEFKADGGLSTAQEQTFVWKKCFNVKVDVKFDLSAQEKSETKAKIVSISKPYLRTTTDQSARNESEESQGFDWLADIVAKVDRLRDGCTKQDIEELFDMDGGIRPVSIERYRLKDYSYIKVDAVFDESAGGGSPKLRQMSQLYLEFPYID